MKKIIELYRKKGVFSLFYAGIIITLLLVLLSITTQLKIAENSSWVNHTYQILQETEKLLSYLKDAETGQRGFLLTGEEPYLEPYHQGKIDTYQTLTKLKSLTQDNVAQQQRLFLIEKDITEKFSELALTVQLTKELGPDKALQVVRSGKGKEIMDNLRTKLSQFEAVEKDLLDKRTEILAASTYRMQAIQIIAGLLVMAILITTITLLKKNTRRQKVLFSTIDKQNHDLLMDVAAGNHLVTARTADETVDNLVTNLKNATEFIKQVGKGHYDAQLAGITQENIHKNQDNLAGSLLQMREQLKQVAEEDSKRNWATQGLAQFGEMLRMKNNNLDELSFNIISGLVKYMKANQGGLFISNDENTNHAFLELRACYAFDKKKYIKKTIQIGEGLVGQAVQEADTIFLTEVPPDYIHITSGLGTANPRSIVIIPLKLNDKVFGAIELASFQIFKKYEIDFMEKLAESIASAISTVKINEQTRQLLAASRQQTEELRAQEEEMRQNIEELAATQEEMLRSKSEIEQLLQEAQRKEKIMQEQERVMRGSLEEITLMQSELYQKDQKQVKEIKILKQSFQEKEQEMQELIVEMKVNEEDMQKNEERYRKLILEFQTIQIELDEKTALIEQLEQENTALKRIIH